MLLVDTNIFVAAADTSTPEHEQCVAVLDEHSDLVVPAPVAVETAWMIESRLGAEAEAAFVDSVATGELGVSESMHPPRTRGCGFVAECAVLVASPRLAYRLGS
jgi:predicted nucleic acid-binding protein